jgi:tetratricopeptide (TPR) repeat protein
MRLLKQKQYAEAIAEYRIALRWNPRLAPLLFRLGTALLENGKIDEAITYPGKGQFPRPKFTRNRRRLSPRPCAGTALLIDA